MKVLLVEDDASLREGLTELLTELADVRPAASVEEALAALREDVFDLVLTDLRIGGVRDGGKRVVEASRAAFTAVVILSAMQREEIERAMEGAPPDDILTKPFQLEDALAVTEKFLKEKRLAQSIAQAPFLPAAFNEVAPGYEVAPVGAGPGYAARWVRLAPQAQLEWRAESARELFFLVDGVVQTPGGDRRAGHALHLWRGGSVRLLATDGVLGVAVAATAAR